MFAFRICRLEAAYPAAAGAGNDDPLALHQHDEIRQGFQQRLGHSTRMLGKGRQPYLDAGREALIARGPGHCTSTMVH